MIKQDTASINEALKGTKRKYSFVGAGLYGPYHMGIAIYIKYKFGPNEIRLKEQSSKHVHIICPDRELYIVNDKHHAHPYQPPFDYDEIVNVSPFWPVTGINTGITNYMMNYAQYIGREKNSPKLRLHGRLPQHNQTIYADSGGFQLKSGKFDYINPKSVINWYNENVDKGMVLDIPSSGYYWEGLIEKMAQAQSRNIDIMLANKREDLELINIFHGQNLNDINKYRAIVERPEIDIVSIGGAYYHTVLQSIDHACRIMTSGRQYKQYHMLGIGNIRQIYALMRMAHKGIAPYITSDASTFIQEALNKGYFLAPTIDSPPRHYLIGDTANKPNAGQVLPCSCPVCSAIKYTDILVAFTGNILAFLLLYHNLFRFTQHCRAMYDIIGTASKQDLKQLLRSQLETRKHGRDETLACIDYVDDFAEAGADYAAQRCAYFLATDSDEDVEMPSLFNSNNNDVDLDTRDNDELDPQHPIRKRMDRILDDYIGQEESDAKHSKVKSEDRVHKHQGHMKDVSGFSKTPGKRKKKSVKVVTPTVINDNKKVTLTKEQQKELKKQKAKKALDSLISKV